MGFEPTIPVFERVKTVHALDVTATLIGITSFCTSLSRAKRIGYEPDDRGRIPGRNMRSSLRHSVVPSLGDHPSSYTMRSRPERETEN
jgi:hypothetical protein